MFGVSFQRQNFPIKRLLDTRFAKRKLDEYVFLGNRLNVSYAPHFETLSDTKEKLESRRKEVLARSNRMLFFFAVLILLYIIVIFNMEVFLFWSYVILLNYPSEVIVVISLISAGRSKGSVVRKSGSLAEASFEASPSLAGLPQQVNTGKR